MTPAAIKRTLALLVPLALFLGACSSSSGSKTASSGGGGQMPKLSVAVYAANPLFSHVYLAKANGYFTKEGVDVTLLDNTGANTLNEVVAGQADLGMIGAGAPLIAAKNGKSTTMIYAHVGNANGGVVVARPNITSLSQMKRVATGSTGSSAYGYCQFYKTKLHLNYECVPFQDVQSLNGALAAGRVDAGIDAYVVFQPLIAKNTVHVLIDTRQASVRKAQVGPDFPEAAIFGLTDNLKKKRTAVIKFLTAVMLAQKAFISETPSQIAQQLHGLSEFSNTDPSALQAQVQDAIPYLAPNNGRISESTWTYAVSQYALWGIGVDSSNPVFSYAKRVDMSYYDAAAKLA